MRQIILLSVAHLTVVLLTLVWANTLTENEVSQPDAGLVPVTASEQLLEPPALPADVLAAAPGTGREPATVAEPSFSPPPPSPAPKTYTVKAGDTLIAIALNHDISLSALMAANNLTTSIIRPGDVLYIPDPLPASQ